jgi:hypothetical protein
MMEPLMEHSRARQHQCRPRSIAALTLAVLLAAAGCGGSSKSEAPGSGSSVTSVATARLIATADAICERLDARLARTTPVHLDSRTIARSAPQNAALERAALTELGKLAPPASLADDWKQIIAYRRTLADELARLGRYAKANDTRAVKALAVSKKRVHEKLFALAARDGFRVCSQVSTGRSTKPTGPSPPPTRATRTSAEGAAKVAEWREARASELKKYRRRDMETHPHVAATRGYSASEMSTDPLPLAIAPTLAGALTRSRLRPE